MEQKKIAYFGGTFDPVHTGHVAVALDTLRIVKLDEVCFLPAQHNPLKANAPQASFEQRLEMVQLAIEGKTGLACSDLEAQQSQPSYTYSVVQQLVKRQQQNSLYWIIGADQLENLHKWYAIEKLSKLVTFLVLERPGYRTNLDLLKRIEGIRFLCIANKHMDVSATEVRQWISRNKCPQNLLCEKVLAYIQKNNLYSPSLK